MMHAGVFALGRLEHLNTPGLSTCVSLPSKHSRSSLSPGDWGTKGPDCLRDGRMKLPASQVRASAHSKPPKRGGSHPRRGLVRNEAYQFRLRPDLSGADSGLDAVLRRD